MDLNNMNEEQDKHAIHGVINSWIRATADGDIHRILNLMAEDVVFLMPGQPPMRGRDAFAAAFQSIIGKVRIEGKPDIQEIHVAGNLAFCWNNLSVTITPTADGPPKRRVGPILSVFRREPDGRWVLFRDANMLTAVD
ncbi:MAG TPA: SgcJ/EcaC family oxidoreductase [Verrucomicrobiae bacterium]|nr:SgcJ/EcaC family oxidoreductase [Verrucomicrobiae bacterium]